MVSFPVAKIYQFLALFVLFHRAKRVDSWDLVTYQPTYGAQANVEGIRSGLGSLLMLIGVFSLAYGCDFPVTLPLFALSVGAVVCYLFVGLVYHLIEPHCRKNCFPNRGKLVKYQLRSFFGGSLFFSGTSAGGHFLLQGPLRWFCDQAPEALSNKSETSISLSDEEQLLCLQLLAVFSCYEVVMSFVAGGGGALLVYWFSHHSLKLTRGLKRFLWRLSVSRRELSVALTSPRGDLREEGYSEL